MKHFKVYELVSKTVYQKYGDNSVRFLDDRLLKTVDAIREILGVPLVINDWYWGGKNQQRGLRENTCQIVKSKGNTLYLSAHCLGRAADFVSAKMTAADMRKKLEANKSKLPYNIRIESDVTWLHIDLNMVETKEKITYFKA